MSQYCTLQEAYNVPSFSRKKKGCLPVEPNASADPYEPYSEQRGKELTSIEKFQDKPQARQDAMGEGERVTYKGMTTDYDYYCKNFGICALEGFNSSQAPVGSGITQSPPPTARTVAPGPPARAPAPAKDKCSPLDPPNYEYPISDADKAKFQAALKIALEQMETSVPPAQSAGLQRPIQNNQIQGFVDEELESYMTVNEMNAAPKIMPLTVPKPSLAEVPGYDKQAGQTTPFEAEIKKTQRKSYTKTNKVWMDLLLFVASGLLLIFLLEQLYKIALMTGVRRTITAIDNILQSRSAAQATGGGDFFLD
jgi:hypothetical protein